MWLINFYTANLICFLFVCKFYYKKMINLTMI